MKRLPVEILEIIFQHLYQGDRAKCRRVCRYWNHVIENSGICTTLWLHGKERLDKFLYQTPLKTHITERTERLIINLSSCSISDIDILPYRFPKISEITVYPRRPSGYYKNLRDQYVHPWKKRIKVIRDRFNALFTLQILNGGVCPSLTEIQIRRNHGDKTEDLIEHLVNAPNLKILTLHCYHMTLKNLETLHKNVPFLESLKLTDSRIYNETLPIDIKPATSMKKLELMDVYISDKNTIHFKTYFVNKYSCIVELMFCAFYFDQLEHVTAPRRRGYIPHVGFRAGTDHSVFRCNAINPFIFLMLDMYGFKIRRVTLPLELEYSDIRAVLGSIQVRYIQALSCKIFSPSVITRHLRSLMSLTELQLNVEKCEKVLVLNHLMDTIGGNLEMLDLCNAIISVNRYPIPHCPRLKKLGLRNVNQPLDLDYFMSKGFPNLRSFTIDRCTFFPSTYKMENLRLTNLEIRMPAQRFDTLKCGVRVLITTTNDDTKRWYTAKKQPDRGVHPINNPRFCTFVKSKPYEKYAEKQLMAFKLGALYNIPFITCF